MADPPHVRLLVAEAKVLQAGRVPHAVEIWAQTWSFSGGADVEHYLECIFSRSCRISTFSGLPPDGALRMEVHRPQTFDSGVDRDNNG